MRRALLHISLAVLASLAVRQVPAASLMIAKGPSNVEVTLAWTEGVADFEVFRSETPQALIDPANEIAFTPLSSWIDQPPEVPIVFYTVLGADDYPFFSEYVEGTLTNKALEIYNNGSAIYELGSCAIRTYMNGGVNPSVYPLSPLALASGDVVVICYSGAGPGLQGQCDQITASAALAFNGDDAVELFCGNRTRDVIGQIGFDPGSEWGVGVTSTRDATLRRKCVVSAGDSDGSDAFDPAAQWDGFAVDTFEDLGLPSCGS